MARQHSTSGSLQSIAGGALVGLGLHIWFGNLHEVASQLSAPFRHLLRRDVGPGVLSHRGGGAGRPGLRLGSLGVLLEVLRMLVSFWPLLLVIVGAGFLRDVFTDEVDPLTAPEKYFQDNDTGRRFCCPSFDT